MQPDARRARRARPQTTPHERTNGRTVDVDVVVDVERIDGHFICAIPTRSQTGLGRSDAGRFTRSKRTVFVCVRACVHWTDAATLASLAA